MVAGREQNLRAPLEIHRAPRPKRLAGSMRRGAHVERGGDFDLADFFERPRTVNIDDLPWFDA
jgi:hypothetical protein